MKKTVGKYAVVALVVINVALAAALVLCAYAGCFPPQHYPRLSVLPLVFPFLILPNIIFAMLFLFVRRKMALISGIALLLTLPDIRAFCPINLSGQAPQGSLRLMSMNLGATKGAKADSLIRYLVDSKADIVCFQETMCKGAWFDRPGLKEIYPYSGKQGKEVVISCISKYPVVDARTIDYESEGNMSACFSVKIGDDTLHVVNNHFQSYHIGGKLLDEYKGITSRVASMKTREKNTRDVVAHLIEANAKRGPQVDSVYKFVENLKGKLVVACGDFNETANGYAHYKLTKLLNDAYTRSANGWGFSYSRNKIHYRIDHILCSPSISAYDSFVDGTCTLSDHFPIVSSLKLP